MIAAEPTSFTIHDVTPSEMDIEVFDAEVVKPEEKETAVVDQPIASSSNQPNIEPAVLFELEDDSQPVVAQGKNQPKEEEEITRFVLEMDEEEPVAVTKTSLKATPVKTAEKPFSPIDGTIQEGLSNRTEERKQQLKQFNYRFSQNKRVDDLEREPAYKRQDVSLERPEQDGATSRTSLSTDSNDGLQLRTNNSFLHDNVD
jgi:cell division protein FtsZ